MTTGRFQSTAIDFIWVDRVERQRKELRGVEELAESIARRGLIHPILITEEGKLVAGERRWEACKLLGWTAVSTQFAEDLSDEDLYDLELEENVKREDLTWQEEVFAVARLHEFKRSRNEEWTQDDTAAAIGYSQQEVSRRLAVASNMDNEVVAKADRLSAAFNIVERNTARKKASALDAVAAAVGSSLDTAVAADPEAAEVLQVSPPEAPVIPLLNTSFHDWQETYDGPKFNLIHCDFPYGINVADSARMDATIRDHYEDSPDIYWDLLARLGLAMNNVVADSAHLIFWHSMKYHADTIEALTRMGWKCNPFPLIWHKSDGSGIAPRPQDDPRQTYEAAIFAVRGNQKLTAAGCVANSFAYPGRRDDAIHVSEKPYGMLRHFLRMVCDEYSFVLDPTCGSANALKVAEDLGAPRVLGLEQMPEFYEIACDNWEKRGE